jgi:hypothetical protein
MRFPGIFCASGFGNDDGMTVRRTKPRVKADLLAMRHEPFRAGEQILFVLRLGGDAGKAQVIAKLGEEPVLMLFQKMQNGLHAIS